MAGFSDIAAPRTGSYGRILALLNGPPSTTLPIQIQYLQTGTYHNLKKWK
jgi:hypothetical protein